MKRTIVILGAILVLAGCGSSAATYQQGYSYAAKYMAAPGGGNLIVPLSDLPSVCGGIAKGNPYGVSGAPGANPGASWMNGCETGIKASPHYEMPAPASSPPAAQPPPETSPQDFTYRAGYRYGLHVPSVQSCLDEDPSAGWKGHDSVYPVTQGSSWFEGCADASRGHPPSPGSYRN